MSEPKGVSTVKNKNGFFVVKLHYTADPAKTLEWAAENKKTYPSLDIWSQEMELDFTKSTGLRIYPDFKEHIHVKDGLKPVPYKDILRFWDFGYRHPVCVFGQLIDDQLILLNEMFGQDIVILEFAKAVKRLTKQAYPGFEVKDYCDPAGKFKSDKSERTTIDILHMLGIYPRFVNSSVKDGINLVRTLLLVREDGKPGLIADRSCKITVDAFLGGYVRDEVTDEPVKDGFYEHPMDAVRYGAVNVFSVRNFKPIAISHPFIPQRKTVSQYTGY